MTEILNYPKCYKHPGGEYFLLVLTQSTLSQHQGAQSSRIIAKLSLTLLTLSPRPGS